MAAPPWGSSRIVCQIAQPQRGAALCGSCTLAHTTCSWKWAGPRGNLLNGEYLLAAQLGKNYICAWELPEESASSVAWAPLAAALRSGVGGKGGGGYGLAGVGSG